MTAAKRIDPDRTTEMEIPPEIKANIEKLKKERQSISQKIEETKIQAEVRKEDESTVVFNLRQHQLQLKVEELEQKKTEAEKELNHLLQGKNVKLHSDMRKVAQFLINEVKKITPLNKEIHEKVSDLSVLKDELKQFQQEQNTERSQARKDLQKQGHDLRHLSELMQQTSQHLRSDFDKAVHELEILRKEKATEEKSLYQIREDLVHQEAKLQGYEVKQAEYAKLQDEISKLRPKLLELANTEAAIQDIQLKKENRINELNELNEEHDHKLQNYRLLEASLHKVEIKLQHSEQEIDRKQGILSALNQEILDSSRRIEASRLQEMDVMTSYKSELAALSRLQGEVTQLEAKKTIALELQKESSKFYEQEKESYEAQLKLMNENHASRLGELKAEFEVKKLEWEQEFMDFSASREAELHQRLSQLEARNTEEMRQRQKEFTKLMSDLIKHQLTRPEFSSLEQKIKETEKETQRFYESFFGPRTKRRFWFW